MWNRVGRRTLAYLLLGAGTLLAFAGARDFLLSRIGQIEARSANPAPLPHLQPGDLVARLLIPRLHSDLFVVEGDGAAQLRRGPGHLSDSAMPGGAGNCVIAGHRDTHFRVLRSIHAGDSIVLETSSGRFVYRVVRTSIVSPDDTSALQPAPRTLHLITCYPFHFLGPAPRRFVVEATLQEPPPDSPTPSAESTF